MGRTACTETQCLSKGALYLFFLPFLALVLEEDGWVNFTLILVDPKKETHVPT